MYAGASAINTSDEREKEQIGAIPEAWLDAWADVEWVRYKWKEAVAIKGDGARWHTGLIAQRVKDAFEAHGIDPFEIGVLCHDAWEASPEVTYTEGKVVKQPELQEGGTFSDPVIEDIIHTVPGETAGERYGVRYDEAQALEAALQRREVSRLRDELAALRASV